MTILLLATSTCYGLSIERYSFTWEDVNTRDVIRWEGDTAVVREGSSMQELSCRITAGVGCWRSDGRPGQGDCREDKQSVQPASEGKQRISWVTCRQICAMAGRQRLSRASLKVQSSLARNNPRLPQVEILSWPASVRLLD